jgi:hypothetical protein
LGFEVPGFCVIPAGFPYANSRQLQEVYGRLRKPLAVRSSAAPEDSRGHSFAGMFKSMLRIGSYDAFEQGIQEVLKSARGERALDYARRHGIQIDDRMAVIVQEMISPEFSGVSYSTTNPKNPRTKVEFVKGLSEGLMSGEIQGNVASFDSDFNLVMEYGCSFPGLERVAKVARGLESVCGEKVDVEFAVSNDGTLYLLQSRPVTDPAWPDVQIPDVHADRIVFEADIVRGAGVFNGPVFVFRSGKELRNYCMAKNLEFMPEFHEQNRKAREFNAGAEKGYTLVTDNLEGHNILMMNDGLSNLRALVTVDYASRFSHPINIVSETGAFYMGAVGRKDLLARIETGDNISAACDQSRGVVYDLNKPEIELKKVDLSGIPAVAFKDAISMRNPHYEAVDNHFFPDGTGKVGVIFHDYNDENGRPDVVFYTLVADGREVGHGEYNAGKAIYQHPDFSSLLKQLLIEATGKIKR